MTEISAKSVEVANDGLSLVIDWGNDHKRRCSSKWLRFNCNCEKCKPAFSGMYPLDRTKFEDKLIVENAVISGNELHCFITKDIYPDHVTKIPLQYLLANCNCNSCITSELAKRRIIPRPIKKSVPYVEYETTFTEEGLFSFLQELMEHGFCVVRNVPTDKEKGIEFGERFSQVRSTLYGRIVAANWHPATEATLRVRECDVDAYYKAHKAFMNIVHNPENQFKFRLQTGEMMIINNHRVAHSREAYTSLEDGDRTLHGYYLDMDDAKSKYMTLAYKLGKNISPPKIAGRSSY